MEALRGHSNSALFLSPETLISSLCKHHFHLHSTLGYVAFSSSSLRSTLTRSTTLPAVSDLCCLLKALRFRVSGKWAKKSKYPMQLIMKDPIITERERERMEQMLYEAAAQGSVTSLYELLLKDPLIIDRVILNYSTETPLHIAALLGRADFAKEILRQKPELAAELDYRRSSPLHLAAAKGYIEIVKVLLLVNPGMCLACDRDGRNPVYLAAMRGRINVLKELVQARPHATRATVQQGETILHLCVKHNQLEALKLLVEAADAHEFVSAKDDNGFTILHLAVADKQVETINYLLSSTSIEVNAVNLNGCTALDILAQSRRDVQDMEISELLRHAGAAKAKNISFSAHEFGSSRTRSMSSHANDQNRVACPIGKNYDKFNKKKEDWLDKQQSALMVVASLIATMAFQAGVSPPGGVWGDNSKDDSKGSPAPSSETPHFAGLSIMADIYPDGYTYFLVCNSLSFLASLSIILLLISGLPINRRLFVWILMVIMWVAVTTMALTYLVSITTFTPNHELDHLHYIIKIATYTWTCLVILLLVAHTIKMIKKLIWRGRSSSMIINGTTTI